MTRWRDIPLVGIFAVLLLAGTPAGADDEAPREILVKDRPDEAVPTLIEFESLAIKFGTGEVQLANGETVGEAQWPALVLARLSTTTFCSATLIGPRVLLTAAHCVDARRTADKTATIPVRVKVGNSDIASLSCRMHPAYEAAGIPARKVDPRSADDYALCELAEGVPDTILFETLNTEAPLTSGRPMVLTGYGCTSAWVIGNTIEHGPSDKALRMADGALHLVNVADSSGAAGSFVAARAEPREDPYICPGDSGGPMIIGTSLEHPTPRTRRLAGVNSKLVALEHEGHFDFYSFIAPVNSASFSSFLTNWQGGGASPGYRAACGAGLQPGEDNCRGD